MAVQKSLRGPGEAPSVEGDAKAVLRFVQDELRAMVLRLNTPQEVRLTPQHVEPERPREGMLVLADGTDWNPGSGVGLYRYTGVAWEMIGGDMTAAEILAALLTVDGPGSGLNADLLDNSSSAAFLLVANNLSDVASLSTTSANLAPFSGCDYQEFLSTDTWEKPTHARFTANSLVMIEMLSGAGSGASRTTTGNASGGAGGGYYVAFCKLSELDSTETATIGADAAAVSGNSNGNPGTDVSFTVGGGKTITVLGATAATHAANGSPTSGAISGHPLDLEPPGAATAAVFWNQAAATATSSAPWGGPGGRTSAGNVPNAGGNSVNGGGGGGGSASTAGGTRTGGISRLAGNGGDGGTNVGGAGANGITDGGGGGGAVQGATSGIGRNGRIRVWVYPSAS